MLLSQLRPRHSGLVRLFRPPLSRTRPEGLWRSCNNITLSHLVTLVASGHIGHIWSPCHIRSHLIILLSLSHIGHIWSHLSHWSHLDFPGSPISQWSHWSYLVTLVTLVTYLHIWLHLVTPGHISIVTSDHRWSHLITLITGGHIWSHWSYWSQLRHR